MRRIYVEHLKTDMIVARTIYSSDGQLLLRSGMNITEPIIKRLIDLKVSSIYIKSHKEEETEWAEAISEEFRQATILLVKDSFTRIEHDRRLYSTLIKEVVSNIISDLLENNNVVTGLSNIRYYDNYTFAHSVNVCILALLIGITLDFDEDKLLELGVGSLLHDIGKTIVSKDILNKPDDLDNDEFEEIKYHTEYGFEILKSYRNISLESAYIALQHHERWDGHGYPQRLSKEEIHLYSRITAVADVYDALLADRPYRPSYTIHQAITIIKRMSDVYLDEKCVDALVSNIAIYPLGSVVQLNTGDIGTVVDVNINQPDRPIIRLLYDRFFRTINKNDEIDLSKYSTILISRILNEKDLDI